MHYALKCPSEDGQGFTETVVREWIEPLTSFLRDPFAKICKDLGHKAKLLQSKDFLLVRNSGVVAPVLKPRGRVILVDAGCGMYSGPQVWQPYCVAAAIASVPTGMPLI